ncbi:unnamed protein product [Amoebophrya sp. A120]|nr:unnamed protein product [Amoebophrya sp. A120]|eukprot:GSA120T00017118001.1
MSSKLDILARYAGGGAGAQNSSGKEKGHKKQKAEKNIMLRVRDEGDIDDMRRQKPKKKRKREDELGMDLERGDVQIVNSADLLTAQSRIKENKILTSVFDPDSAAINDRGTNNNTYREDRNADAVVSNFRARNKREHMTTSTTNIEKKKSPVRGRGAVVGHRAESDSDASVPRERPAGRNERIAKKENDSDSDVSLPRERPGDLTSKRGRKETVSDSDASPPRENKAKANSSPLPPASRGRGGGPRSDNDASPPRERSSAGQKAGKEQQGKHSARGSESDSDASPPRSRGPAANGGEVVDDAQKKQAAAQQENDSDSDVSLPRERPATTAAARQEQNDNDSEDHKAKNKRRKGSGAGAAEDKKDGADSDILSSSDSDVSLPRERPAGAGPAGSTGDKASPRRRAASDSDASPPREQGRKEAENSEEAGDTRVGHWKAGIMTNEDIQKQNAEIARRKEIERERAERIHKANQQQTKFRDAQGRLISAEEYKKQQERKKRKQYDRQDASKWGKGLEQERRQEQRREYEKRVGEEETFARHTIDEHLSAENKAKDRWDDPLAEFEAKHVAGDAAAKKTSKNKDGTPATAPAAPPPPKPKCKFAMPTNRYNIKPGYRWDGKIRGTGFEENMLAAMNHAQQRQAAKDLWERREW